MDDLERFGSRLAASLQRLADDIPTDVDTDLYAASTVRLAGRRHRLAGPWGRSELAVPRPLRLVLAVAALVGLAFAMLLVAQGVRPSVVTGSVHGELVCSDLLPAAALPADLACASELSDPGFSGPVDLRLDPATLFAAGASRAGTMTIRGANGTWSGPVHVVVGPNGLVGGDATLASDGAAIESVLEVRLVAGGGTRWGVLGTVRRTR